MKPNRKLLRRYGPIALLLFLGTLTLGVGFLLPGLAFLGQHLLVWGGVLLGAGTSWLTFEQWIDGRWLNFKYKHGLLRPRSEGHHGPGRPLGLVLGLVGLGAGVAVMAGLVGASPDDAWRIGTASSLVGGGAFVTYGFAVSWANIQGKPNVVVSPTGAASNGQLANNGADFGPDTAGTTTSGIQEAGDALIASGGGELRLINGNYSISSPVIFTLNITTTQYIRILGSGQGTVITPSIALTGPVLTVQGSSLANSPFNRSEVRNIKFDANSNATKGLYINYLPGAVIENVLAYNATSHGIDIESSWNSRVVNCQAQSNGGWGLYATGNNIMSVYGGWYAANTTGGVYSDSNQVYIEGTTSQSNTGYGIELTGLSAILKNCWLERNGTYQLYGVNIGRILTQVVLFDVPVGAHGALLTNVSNCVLDSVSNNGVDDSIDINFSDVTSQYGIYVKNVSMSQLTFVPTPTNPTANMGFTSGAVEQNPFAFDLVVLLNIQLSPTSTAAASLEMGSSLTNTVGLITAASSPAAGAVEFVSVPLHIPSGGWYEIVLINASLQNAIAYRV